jgi:hypothetical protein
MISRDEYEHDVYTLTERHSSIVYSTLVLHPLGRTLMELEGEVHFAGDVKLSVYELIDLNEGRIRQYGYEVYRGDEILYWYDSAEHPTDENLKSTHPHHKHIHPDIKHHRIPAERLSFDQPNLDFLLDEIERTVVSE